MCFIFCFSVSRKSFFCKGRFASTTDFVSVCCTLDVCPLPIMDPCSIFGMVFVCRVAFETVAWGGVVSCAAFAVNPFVALFACVIASSCPRSAVNFCDITLPVGAQVFGDVCLPVDPGFICWPVVSEGCGSFPCGMK